MKNVKLLMLIVTMLFPINAWAYLDPGTGSMIIQGVIGAIAAGMVAGRMYWQKIKAFFGKKDKIDDDITG